MIRIKLKTPPTRDQSHMNGISIFRARTILYYMQPRPDLPPPPPPHVSVYGPGWDVID